MPDETPIDVIERIKVIEARINTIGVVLPQSTVLAATIKLMEQNPTWAAVIHNMLANAATTEITLQSLQRTFNNSNSSEVPGAMMVTPGGPIKQMLQSVAAMAREIQQLKSGSQSNPNRGKQQQKQMRKAPYQTTGRGTNQRGRGSNAGGRGAGRTGPLIICHNCGKKGHKSPECYNNCGTCGNKNHKAPHCPKKQSQPPLTDRRVRFANVNLAEAEPKHVDGFANMAYAHVPFRNLPAASDSLRFPPGFVPPGVNSPPADVFSQGIIGTASSVATLPNGEQSVWISDSGASNHMTPIRSYLFDYTEDRVDRPVYVRVANKHTVKREGVDSMRVTTHIDGRIMQRVIRDVWFMPDFYHSLLSTGQLKRQGCWLISGWKGDMNEYFMDKTNV